MDVWHRVDINGAMLRVNANDGGRNHVLHQRLWATTRMILDALHLLDIHGVNRPENANDDGKNHVHRIMSLIWSVMIWIFMDVSPLQDTDGAAERRNATDRGRTRAVTP